MKNILHHSSKDSDNFSDKKLKSSISYVTLKDSSELALKSLR